MEKSAKNAVEIKIRSNYSRQNRKGKVTVVIPARVKNPDSPRRRLYSLSELYALRAGSRPGSPTGWKRGRRPGGAKLLTAGLTAIPGKPSFDALHLGAIMDAYTLYLVGSPVSVSIFV